MLTLKILIVTSIFPPDIGGPATYVPYIAEYLVHRGHQVTVLTLGEGEKDENDNSYSFMLIRILRAEFKLKRWIKTLLKILKLGSKADLLFVNGLAMETALANILLRKVVVSKVVGDLAWERACLAEDILDTLDDFQKKQYSWRIELVKCLRVWWTNQARYIIVPSYYLAELVKKWGVSDSKIIVIYNGIDIPNPIPDIEIPLTTKHNILMVNRLTAWKRVDEVIRLLPDLDESVGLVIVGDGPQRHQLEVLGSELGVDHRIYFAGQQSKSKVFGFMYASDLLVLYSTYEGLPHVIIEAAMVGIPVVATAVGGTPEVIKNGVNGYLVPVNDRRSLYQAIITSLGMSSCQIPIDKSKLPAKFKLTEMLLSTAEFIEQVAKPHGHKNSFPIKDNH